jgi:hypothetical protein
MKDTITRGQPAPARVAPPGPPPAPAGRKRSAAPAPSATTGRSVWLRVVSKHRVLGTAFLMEKVHDWGRNKVLGWLFVLFFGVPALTILLAAALPYLVYGVGAPSSYQPVVFQYVGMLGAPGETDANGLQHPTTLLVTYSDHLTLVELPAGDAKRTSTLDATTFQQHGSRPRILSMTFEPHQGRAHPDLVVRVSMDWQALRPDIFAFVLANHPEYLSLKAGTPGYQAVQFGVVTVTKEQHWLLDW